MADNTEDKGSIFTAEAPPDLIKGWNEKRQSNNTVISGLTPFVQLIGLFNLEDYRKMLSADDWLDKRKVYYVDDGQETEVALGNVDENLVEEDLYAQLESKLSSRYINLYMADVRVQGSDNSPIAGITPSNGIIMAESISQSKDNLGGVGITDLQIDYGKQAALGARTFTMRLTVNDPSILNDRPEYSKLATQFGEFLLLYGWSNPTLVPGYDAIPPPVLEPDPTDSSKQMMVVPLVNMESGGYWSASRVNISKYDFSFNEVGQLDITAVFRDMTTIHLTTTKLSTIAPTFKRLFATADYDPKAKKPGALGRTGTDFLSLMVTNADGTSKSIVDNFIEEQNSLNIGNTVANSSPSFIPIIGGGSVDTGGNFIPPSDATLKDKLDALDADSSPYGAIPTGNAATFANRQRNESQGFPRSIGIATYEKIETLGVSDDEEEDEGGEVDVQTNYKIKTVYYYLGWIMEGIRLSLADTNRSRVQAGDTAFNPKFSYLHNEDTSKLSTAFQSQIERANRSSSMEERIQEAIIRLKENCLPPLRLTGDPATIDETYDRYAYRKFVPDLPDSQFAFGSIVFGYKKKTISPCMGKVEYEGIQTPTKDAWVSENIDLPDRYEDDNSVKMAEPYRSSAMRGAVQSAESLGATDKLGDTEDGRPRVFRPDYPAMRDHDGVIVGGSEEGYNPRTPTTYRAASRTGAPGQAEATDGNPAQTGTFFYYKVSYEYRTGGGTITVVVIEEVDAYRKHDKELWQSTQRKWNNLYRRYLSTYFEQTINSRIKELESEGKTVEDIYDEPIDLDFLTSRVYRNEGFKDESKKLMHLDESEISKYIGDLTSDLETKITQQNAKIGEINDKIDALKMEMYGETVMMGAGGLDEASADDIDEDRSGFKPDGTKSVNKIITDTLHEINVFKTAGNFTNNTRIAGTNEYNLPYGIEVLTGGKYYEDVDEFGNRIYTRFRSWRGLEMGPEKVIQPGGVAIPIQRDILPVYTPLREGETPSAPSIEYFLYLWKDLWPDYAYQDRSTMSDLSRADPVNLVPLERIIAGELHTMQQSKAFAAAGGEDLWKAENDFDFETDYVQKIINFLLERINSLEGGNDQNEPLNKAYRTMRGMQSGIDLMENEKTLLEAKIANLNKFLNQSTGGGVKELSLYDDTSDFDEIVYIPCGREQEMELTTRVAQYFKAMLDKKHTPMRGVIDIENYGPAWGGTQYYYPSNTRRFLFDPRKTYAPIKGHPRVILDPEEMGLLQDKVDESGLDVIVLSDLSWKVGGQMSPPYNDLLNEPTEAGIWQSLYNMWGIFGNPDIPNERKEIDGHDVTTNNYGFIPGARILDANNQLVGGGNYVANYGEFLELFGLAINNTWPGALKIVGEWPRPNGNIHYEMIGALADEDSDEWVVTRTSLKYFYMIDDDNNIVMPGVSDAAGSKYGDTTGTMVQTGYYLGYDNHPVYLYPDRNHSVKVNPAVAPGSSNYVTGIGHLSADDTPFDTQSKKSDGDDKAKVRYTPGNRNSLPRKWYTDAGNSSPSSRNMFRDINEGKPYSAPPPVSVDFTDRERDPHGTLTFGAHKDELEQWWRSAYQLGASRAYGPRLDRWDHNMNLTLDQKRSLVIPRGAYKDVDLTDLNSGMAANKEIYFLGQDKPSEAGEGDTDLNWSEIGKEGSATEDERDTAIANGWPEDARDRVRAGAKYEDGKIVEPTKARTGSYTNPYYPFGTGYYWAGLDKDGNEKNLDKVRGSVSAPMHSQNKHYLYMGDFLDILPGNGFFTKVNNNDYSPSTISNDGTIVQGAELNTGVVKFIIENVLATIGRNRRVGSRTYDSFNKPRAPIKVTDGGRDNKAHAKWKIVDTTYRHLFSIEDDEEGDVSPGPSFANLSGLQIDSAGDIPIRRDIVDNLMTKNNTNMSIAQFLQEITRPGAIGINTGNINMGFRQRADGVYEVFQANKNWRDTARKIYEDWDKTTLDTTVQANRYPTNHMLFDYKANDSLIENIDMNSKFDPAVALTFKRGAMDFTQDSDVFAKFLAYGNIAPDLVQFLAEQDAGSAGGSNPTSYAGAITVGGGSAGLAGRVVIQKDAFTGDNRMVPQNVISQFLMQKPERQAKLNTFLQMQAGGNFTTQLMANYMRSATITIHGTVNIIPFNTIHIRGVLPDLEGVYLVTNTRDSITPQGFSTVLNAVLLEPLNAYQNQTG